MKKKSLLKTLLFLSSFAFLYAKDMGTAYLTWDTFKYVSTEFFGIPATVEYCCEKNENAKSEKTKWKGQAVTRKIYFCSYTLGEGQPGSDEYIIPKEAKTVSLPYYTNEEKRIAREAIKAESVKKKEQTERLSEDKKLNPDRLAYAVSEKIDFSELKPIFNADSPRFSEGKIYEADSINLFVSNYTIKSDGIRFSFMANNGRYMRNRYEFLLLNSDEITASGNFVKYLGVAELTDGFGNIRYFEKWELLKENPSVVETIKNPLDYNNIELPESSAE